MLYVFLYLCSPFVILYVSYEFIIEIVLGKLDYNMIHDTITAVPNFMN